MARPTPKQRVEAAKAREYAAANKLKKAKKGSKAYKAAKYEIKLAVRQQKRGYAAARYKITGKRPKGYSPKDKNKRKKSSQRGKKTETTSKRTVRSTRGKKRKR